MEKKPMTVNCREKERTLGRKGERGREGETERGKERQREWNQLLDTIVL